MNLSISISDLNIKLRRTSEGVEAWADSTMQMAINGKDVTIPLTSMKLDAEPFKEAFERAEKEFGSKFEALNPKAEEGA